MVASEPFSLSTLFLEAMALGARMTKHDLAPYCYCLWVANFSEESKFILLAPVTENLTIRTEYELPGYAPPEFWR